MFGKVQRVAFDVCLIFGLFPSTSTCVGVFELSIKVQLAFLQANEREKYISKNIPGFILMNLPFLRQDGFIGNNKNIFQHEKTTDGRCM